MTMRVALGLAASMFVLTPFAHADDLPARKPGLWEITLNLGKGPPRVTRLCIDAATDARTRTMGQADMADLCSRHDVNRSGDTVTTDSICRIGSSEVTSHGVTTFTGDAAYSTVIASHYDPPTHGGLADSTTTQEAKWIGPCGADMQPGDMMVQGRKMRLP